MTAPTAYGPELAPPGVDIRFLDRPNSAGVPLWQTRPLMSPRLVLLHTNGASNPGSIDSAFNWANQYNSNTKPHYQVQRDGSAAKLLPSNRVGIGNYKAANFSLVIETQDLGYGPGQPGEAAGYTDEQADTICRILAFEHITAGGNIPLVVPIAWDGGGVGSHTEPFGYDQWTNARGKVCPGQAKKAQLRPQILPLAARYAAEWTAPTPPIPHPTEDDDMANNLRITDNGETVTDVAVFTVSGVFATWQRDGNAEAALEDAGLVAGDKLVRRAGLKGLTLVGPAPDDDNFAAYAAAPANMPGRTRGSDFGARLA